MKRIVLFLTLLSLIYVPVLYAVEYDPNHPEEWSISNCSCVGQTAGFFNNIWVVKIWHDCDNNLEADLICWYIWPNKKNENIITLKCDPVQKGGY